MRREAFLDFLVTRYRGPHTGSTLGDRSASSYCSNAARAEIALQENFDNADLSPTGLEHLARRLRACAVQAGLSQARVSDCLSAVQAYAQFLGSGPASRRSVGQVAPRPSPARATNAIAVAPKPPPRTPDPLVAHMSVTGLLATHGAIMDELRRRDVVRTSNNPVGDYGETLFARAFGWTLATNSALGYDAEDGDGVRYQIKCRRLTRPDGSRQLSAIRRLPDKAFQFLAAILFDETYAVSRAVIVPHELVTARARFIEHTNSWLFMLDDRVWDAPGARDVTAEMRAAAVTL